MTVSALQCAQLCADIYRPPAGSGWLNYFETDNVVVGHTTFGETNVLVLRGSVTAEDWMLDIASEFPVWHSDIGFCGGGFLAGMDDVFEEVRHVLCAPLVITGHSLGGARARILAGLFAVNGIPASQLVTFGSPKPGFINLARIIDKSGTAHTSYRNRNDIVPTVPLTAAPFFDFVHTEDWIAVDAAPPIANLDALRDHSINLYIQALTPTGA